MTRTKAIASSALAPARSADSILAAARCTLRQSALTNRSRSFALTSRTSRACSVTTNGSGALSGNRSRLRRRGGRLCPEDDTLAVGAGRGGAQACSARQSAEASSRSHDDAGAFITERTAAIMPLDEDLGE